MKKHLAGFFIIACLGTFSWAQGNKPDLFDTAKSAQELEIMKGILGTTLSFVAENLQRQEAAKAATKPAASPFYATSGSWRTANINAFYLYGQGAVFVVPASSLRLRSYSTGTRYDTAEIDYLVAREMGEREREIAVQALETARQSAAAAAVAAATPLPPASPKPVAAPAPAAQAQAQLKDEELRKKVAEAQEKVKKSRDEQQANRAKFLAALEQIKVHLIEAIANHGDSLTTVKPNEYLTLVIMTDDLESAIFRSESGRSNQQIISVQKSLVTDYKAGRLTLEAFKQKILQYGE